MEQQRSLRVLDTNKTFFSKLTSTITKMLIPTRVGLNTMMISLFGFFNIILIPFLILVLYLNHFDEVSFLLFQQIHMMHKQ